MKKVPAGTSLILPPHQRIFVIIPMFWLGKGTGGRTRYIAGQQMRRYSDPRVLHRFIQPCVIQSGQEFPAKSLLRAGENLKRTLGMSLLLFQKDHIAPLLPLALHGKALPRTDFLQRSHK